MLDRGQSIGLWSITISLNLVTELLVFKTAEPKYTTE